MSATYEVMVIGGGQAGLSMGYYLTQQGHRFVILDGGTEVGATWRSRYDSLKLFTPAEYNGLPGFPFPTGSSEYPTKDEMADYLVSYAKRFDLPVRTGSPVRRLARTGTGYIAETPTGTYSANQVVVATGPFQRPFVPALSLGLAPEVFQIHSSEYRRPSQVPEGPVLVVGAGNSGAQIAEELAKKRPVYLSVGKKPPYMPQRFLGKDLFWWLHTLGLMGAPVNSWLGQKMRERDPLIGTDLGKLVADLGVTMVGRTDSAEGEVVTFGDGRSLSVKNVIWSTGFRSDYGWIQASVFDQQGLPIHTRGVTSSPGLYFLGLPWQHTRGSALVGGVGRDAAYVAEEIRGRSGR